MNTEEEYIPVKKLKIEKEDFPGYPSYPAEEDIFNNYKEEDLLPVTKVEKPGKWNEKSFEDDVTGSDLDIPGSELDDYQENIGSEDEENNYYSLGGDNHESQEEHIGD